VAFHSSAKLWIDGASVDVAACLATIGVLLEERNRIAGGLLGRRLTFQDFFLVVSDHNPKIAHDLATSAFDQSFVEVVQNRSRVVEHARSLTDVTL
jgi:hypothetical protein